MPDASPQHYGTEAHRRWAKAVIARAGRQCQRCGATGYLVADHIVEIRDGGGALDLANGQALCSPCHASKTAAERRKRQNATT